MQAPLPRPRTSRPAPRLWVFAALALAALGLAFWVTRPLGPEARFALMMIPHHAQAVELADILERRTQDPTLRYFTRDVAMTQASQIGQMRGWLPLWRQLTVGLERPTAQAAAAMGMASQAEITELLGLEGRAAETRFLQLMIRHHQGALPMMDEALADIRTEGLPRRLIEAMRSSQTGETRTMQTWLAERGGETLPFDPSAAPTHGH